MSICIHSGQNLEVSLVRGRVLGFESRRRVLVSCVEGSVWVTAPASDDFVLLADQRVALEATGRVVVQALNTARFRVTENESAEATRSAA